MTEPPSHNSVVRRGEVTMSRDTDKTDRLGHAVLIRRLVEETGITRDEAEELIMLLGVDWSSLVREARALKLKR